MVAKSGLVMEMNKHCSQIHTKSKDMVVSALKRLEQYNSSWSQPHTRITVWFINLQLKNCMTAQKHGISGGIEKQIAYVMVTFFSVNVRKNAQYN